MTTRTQAAYRVPPKHRRTWPANLAMFLIGASLTIALILSAANQWRMLTAAEPASAPLPTAMVVERRVIVNPPVTLPPPVVVSSPDKTSYQRPHAEPAIEPAIVVAPPAPKSEQVRETTPRPTAVPKPGRNNGGR